MNPRQLGFLKDFEKSSFSNLKLLSWKADMVAGWNTTVMLTCSDQVLNLSRHSIGDAPPREDSQ